MPDEPPQLRTGSDPPPPAPSTGADSPYFICDFCKCKITKKGHVLEVSPEARDFRDQKEENRKQVSKLDETITELRAQITAKDAEIATLKNSQPEKRKGTFLVK